MPEPVLEAIKRAQAQSTGSIDDDYRKRLQERFGKRWTMKMLVSGGNKPGPNKPTDQSGSAGSQPHPDEYNGERPNKKDPHRKVIKTTDVSGKQTEQEVPVDIPRYTFGRASDFDQSWHIAAWVPNHPEGPTVLINLDAPTLLESVEYHLKQYPDVFADEVSKTVRGVFGELAVAKVAHSQTLKKHVSEQELDGDYRSEKALTVALMGLMAEESIIARRLMHLGRRDQLSK